MMKMTLKALEDAGYKKFNMGLSAYAMCMYEKTVKDELGKKYFIHIDVFDSYPSQEAGTNNFQPMAQFIDEKDLIPTVNMTYLGRHPNDYTVEEIEVFFERAWEFMGKPYYEKWEND